MNFIKKYRERMNGVMNNFVNKSTKQKLKNLIKRFEIVYINKGNYYIIIDKLKRLSCIKNIKYTNKSFISREQAEGFLFGKGKQNSIVKGGL